jgi:hypothetical protein
MDESGQSSVEYLMTYGWAMVAIAIVLGSVLVLTSNSSVPFQCQMNPSSGAITLTDFFISGNSISFLLRNDSGKTISDVNVSFSGDFSSVSSSNNNGPFSSAQDFKLSSTGFSLAKGTNFSGVVSINYKRNNVRHVSTAICTGTT